MRKISMIMACLLVINLDCMQSKRSNFLSTIDIKDWGVNTQCMLAVCDIKFLKAKKHLEKTKNEDIEELKTFFMNGLCANSRLYNHAECADYQSRILEESKNPDDCLALGQTRNRLFLKDWFKKNNWIVDERPEAWCPQTQKLGCCAYVPQVVLDCEEGIHCLVTTGNLKNASDNLLKACEPIAFLAFDYKTKKYFEPKNKIYNIWALIAQSKIDFWVGDYERSLMRIKIIFDGPFCEINFDAYRLAQQLLIQLAFFLQDGPTLKYIKDKPVLKKCVENFAKKMIVDRFDGLLLAVKSCKTMPKVRKKVKTFLETYRKAQKQKKFNACIPPALQNTFVQQAIAHMKMANCSAQQKINSFATTTSVSEKQQISIQFTNHEQSTNDKTSDCCIDQQDENDLVNPEDTRKGRERANITESLDGIEYNSSLFVNPATNWQAPQHTSYLDGLEFLRKKDVESAHECFLKAYKLLKQPVSDFDLKKQCYVQKINYFRHGVAPLALSTTHMLRGSYDKALDILIIARNEQKFEQYPIPKYIGQSFMHLAYVYRYEPAQEYLRNNPDVIREVKEMETERAKTAIYKYLEQCKPEVADAAFRALQNNYAAEKLVKAQSQNNQQGAITTAKPKKKPTKAEKRAAAIAKQAQKNKTSGRVRKRK